MPLDYYRYRSLGHLLLEAGEVMPVSLFMFSDHLLSHFHSEVIHANDTSRERNQRPVTSKYGSTQVLS